jgi:hypothetical protein
MNTRIIGLIARLKTASTEIGGLIWLGGCPKYKDLQGMVDAQDHIERAIEHLNAIRTINRK